MADPTAAPADSSRAPRTAAPDLEQEGEIAADYLEDLLDIADLDGDIDMDVEARPGRGVDRRSAATWTTWSAATARCSRRCRSSPGSPSCTGDRRAQPADAGHRRVPGRAPRRAHRARREDRRRGQEHRRAGAAGADDARSSARSCTTRSPPPDCAASPRARSRTGVRRRPAGLTPARAGRSAQWLLGWTFHVKQPRALFGARLPRWPSATPRLLSTDGRDRAV